MGRILCDKSPFYHTDYNMGPCLLQLVFQNPGKLTRRRSKTGPKTFCLLFCFKCAMFSWNEKRWDWESKNSAFCAREGLSPAESGPQNRFLKFAQERRCWKWAVGADGLLSLSGLKCLPKAKNWVVPRKSYRLSSLCCGMKAFFVCEIFVFAKGGCKTKAVLSI